MQPSLEKRKRNRHCLSPLLLLQVVLPLAVGQMDLKISSSSLALSISMATLHCVAARNVQFNSILGAIRAAQHQMTSWISTYCKSTWSFVNALLKNLKLAKKRAWDLIFPVVLYSIELVGCSALHFQHWVWKFSSSKMIAFILNDHIWNQPKKCVYCFVNTFFQGVLTAIISVIPNYDLLRCCYFFVSIQPCNWLLKKRKCAMSMMSQFRANMVNKVWNW